MKLMKFIGLTLAAALIFATPAFAAVPGNADPSVTTSSPAPFDCVGSIKTDAAILFVEATTNCEPVMADITGVCMVLAEPDMALNATVLLDPDQGGSCATIRASPPG